MKVYIYTIYLTVGEHTKIHSLPSVTIGLPTQAEIYEEEAKRRNKIIMQAILFFANFAAAAGSGRRLEFSSLQNASNIISAAKLENAPNEFIKSSPKEKMDIPRTSINLSYDLSFAKKTDVFRGGVIAFENGHKREGYRPFTGTSQQPNFDDKPIACFIVTPIPPEAISTTKSIAMQDVLLTTSLKDAWRLAETYSTEPKEKINTLWSKSTATRIPSSLESVLESIPANVTSYMMPKQFAIVDKEIQDQYEKINYLNDTFKDQNNVLSKEERNEILKQYLEEATLYKKKLIKHLYDNHCDSGSLDCLHQLIEDCIYETTVFDVLRELNRDELKNLVEQLKTPKNITAVEQQKFNQLQQSSLRDDTELQQGQKLLACLDDYLYLRRKDKSFADIIAVDEPFREKLGKLLQGKLLSAKEISDNLYLKRFREKK